MKALELTTSHKTKLIKMLKYFYESEYSYIGWYITEDEDFYKHDSFYRFNVLHLIPSTGDKAVVIHWFEFCMTHLVFKISEVLDGQLEDDTSDARRMNIVITSRDWVGEMYLGLMDTWSKSIHPVDYLYKQFLKIK